jgi:hypothetical protein
MKRQNSQLTELIPLSVSEQPKTPSFPFVDLVEDIQRLVLSYVVFTSRALHFHRRLISSVSQT